MINIFPNSMEKLYDNAEGDRVDIIMRTKNRPVLLNRALESVINQSHSNWHIYLINDGGDRAPVETIIGILSTRLLERITLINNETSLGMAAAANMALTRGNSPFVAIHDDDDSWDPTYLAKGTGFLTAVSNRRYGGFLSKWYGIQETFDGTTVEIKGATVKGFDTEILDIVDVLRLPEIPPIALLWRRSVCKHVGYLNENLPVLDDWDLNLRILQIADIAICSEILANHHVRIQSVAAGSYGNSVTQSLATHHRYNTMYRNSMVREYLSQNPEHIGLISTLIRNIELARRNLSDFSVASHQQLYGGIANLNSRVEKMETDIGDIKDMMRKIYEQLNENTISN